MPEFTALSNAVSLYNLRVKYHDPCQILYFLILFYWPNGLPSAMWYSDLNVKYITPCTGSLQVSPDLQDDIAARFTLIM